MFRAFRIAVFAAACLTIAWLSLAPTSALPSVSLWDKVEHAGAYLGLAVLGSWAFPTRRRRLAFGLFAFGVGIEFAQAAMGWGRTGDPWDVLANTVGLTLGLGVARVIGETVMVKSRARGE